ncbi:MAG: glycosyltransferase [Cyanobacteria bacterium]|jgi:glycosyltransferase involved in cell wall biosynthesis|nr:glycosyltransferase [Cyanobacteria bacterium GSL.Bin1]
MSSPKIHTLAYIFTTFPPEVSGSAQYNWERVQWLAEQGLYRVVVLAPDCQNPLSLPSVPSHLRERLIIETYPSKPWIPYNLHYVPTVAATQQIHQRLIHYQPHLITLVDVERAFLFGSWQFPGKGYAKKNQVPYLAEYQTDYYNFAGSYSTWKLLRDIFIRPLTNYLYRQFDTTLVPSQLVNNNLRQMGINNTQYIPFFGIDLSLYSPNHRDRDFLNQWLSPEEKDNKVLLFLGRLSSEKRVDLLIKAFAKLRQDHYSLIIAGDGPMTTLNQLKSLAQPIRNLHFTGFIHGEAKAALLASCDLFCNPSPYETFGRTVVEAMASGLPVVAVNSGAVSEYMKNGVNGYLVQPNHVEALRNAIEKALQNDNQKIIENALKDANQMSSEQGCRNINNHYQTILNSVNLQKLVPL